MPVSGCPRFTQTFTSPMVHTLGSPRLFSNFHHTLTSPRPSYLHLTQTSNHTIISPRPSYPHLTQRQKFKVPNSAMFQSSVGLGKVSLGQVGSSYEAVRAFNLTKLHLTQLSFGKHNRSKHIFMKGECLLPQGQEHASIDQVRLGQVRLGNVRIFESFRIMIPINHILGEVRVKSLGEVKV